MDIMKSNLLKVENNYKLYMWQCDTVWIVKEPLKLKPRKQNSKLTKKQKLHINNNKKEIINGGTDVQEREPLCTIGGNWMDAAPTENSMRVPENVKNKTIILPSNPTSGYLSKRNKVTMSQSYLCSHVYWSVMYRSQDMDTT